MSDCEVVQMIGQVIQRLRQEKRLSLSELADRAGIAKSYLSSIERNIQGNPSIHVLEKICAVLDITVPALLQSANESEVQAEMDSLDPEWIEIVQEAMKSGISKAQFKDFIEFQMWRNKQKEE